MKTVVIFVCVSNVCRSPMAEYLFRNMIEREKDRDPRSNELLDEVVVCSRSLSTDYEPVNSPASSNGVQIMRDEFGISMDDHRSKLLSEADIQEATMIVPVKRDLGRYIEKMFPEAIGKLMYFEKDIEDPWKMPLDVFHACAMDMSKQLEEIFQTLVNKLQATFEL